MELDELKERLGPFVGHHYGPGASVAEVHKMPGHAGFAYGFTVLVPHCHQEEERESWFLRLPPPGVRWVGTADVLRQVAALHMLEEHNERLDDPGLEIPHCRVRWWGTDERWFGCPYFVVPMLEGDVIRFEDGGWTRGLDEGLRRDMARQAMISLARIHSVDWQRPTADGRLSSDYLGEPIEFAEDVARWDRFVEKAAEPQRLALQPRVRELLLEHMPESAPTGLFHGDFQWANLFYSREGRLLAVIDWELVGLGATLNDVGWIATFNDPDAWSDERRSSSSIGIMPLAHELVAMYRDAWQDLGGAELPDLGWYRALAAYKFAIISGLNLSLHRRGKRHDPIWETTALSMEPLLARARELLA